MKTTVIYEVAKLISETSVFRGVSNYDVMSAHRNHKMSGLQRLRELSDKYLMKFIGPSYRYRDNRYYPTSGFKAFCKRYVRENKRGIK